jgi:cytochrome c551/c552
MISKEKACESCHGSGFGRILRNWQVSTEKKLEQIKSAYAKAESEIAASRSAERAKARDLLQEAAFNIDVVDRGKAVHNISYSQDLLLAAVQRIEEALQTAGSSYRPEKLLIETAVAPGQCSQCHAGIEEINTEIYGLSFPHKSHVVGKKMECGLCHSNSRRHGEFIGSKKSCAACHHQDAKKECGSCHSIQKTLYGGGTIEGFSVPKDLMAEAGADCDGCHERKDGRISRSDASTCAGCHEESYKKTFEEWRAAYKELRAGLEAALSEKKALSLSQESKARLTEIEKALRELDQDGSSGVHNSQFIQDILTKLTKEIKSIA